MQKSKVIVIGGPTASGKTSLSIALAKQIQGEIVSADSMQIYEEMDIGTAKPTQEEKEGIEHYMLDIVKPSMRYTVADYKKEAKKAIQAILEKGKIPIVVGGTGLYIDSLIYEIEYLDMETDFNYRRELEKRIEEKGLLSLFQEAKTIDLEATQKISQNDKKRIMRILEIYHQTGKTKTQLEKESRKEPEYEYYVFAIEMNREILYQRINERVDKMIEQGLIKEVTSLLEKYDTFPTAMQGLGYKEIIEYLNKKITKEEAIEIIKQESRRYAKRQLTWFRKNKNTIWLDGLNSTQNNCNIILEEIK